MKTAIIYRSHHGTTSKVARMIAEKLVEKGCQLSLIDLHSNPNPPMMSMKGSLLAALFILE